MDQPAVADPNPIPDNIELILEPLLLPPEPPRRRRGRRGGLLIDGVIIISDADFAARKDQYGDTLRVTDASRDNASLPLQGGPATGLLSRPSCRIAHPALKNLILRHFKTHPSPADELDPRAALLTPPPRRQRQETGIEQLPILPDPPMDLMELPADLVDLATEVPMEVPMEALWRR